MTAAIILAAGESSRLGMPKQNLLFNGQTLLQRVVDAAKKAKCQPIIVVLGANADKIAPIPGIITIYNQDWKEGMASSIRMAIQEIEKDDRIHNAIIMLCDQPFVNSDLIDKMVYAKAQSQSRIIACGYNKTMGVPALFDRSLFIELSTLSGNEGAKEILAGQAQDLTIVPFDLGSVDIDTIADYERLINLYEQQG
jgi:molybdenum cofactor cytidylyltransferase